MLVSDGQIESREVVALGERRRHDHVCELLIRNGGRAGENRGAVLLKGRAELGELEEGLAVEVGRLHIAELVVVTGVLHAVGLHAVVALHTGSRDDGGS